MSKLLNNKDSILLVQIDLACIKDIGVNGALVLQQVHYWIENNKKGYLNDRTHNKYSEVYQLNRFWTYLSLAKWQEYSFPFWSLKTVERTFTKLENSGYLIADNFNKMGSDRTKWYTINYEKLEAIEKDLENLKAKREQKKIEKLQKENRKKLEKEILEKEEKTAVKPDEHSFRQNDEMEKEKKEKASNPDKNSFRQNDELISSDCRTDFVNMSSPLQESKKETYHNTNSSTTQKNSTSSLIQEEKVNLIEENTHLILSANMKKIVSTWDDKRLIASIKIFKELNGKAFALLKKIYYDNNNFVTKNNNSKEEKKLRFCDFKQREYDYDALEKKLLGWDD